MSVSTDPLTGRVIQRSFTFTGAREAAERYCAELAGEYAARRTVLQAAPFVTVGEVIDRWLASDHDWRPSTWSSYRSNGRALRADLLGEARVASLDPMVVRAAMGRWREAGSTASVISGRFRTLRAALSWAYEHRVVERNPIDAMRGPSQPPPRLQAPMADVLVLLRFAERSVEDARSGRDGSSRRAKRLHLAEQMLLLVRLAADTGARRGELASLRIGDLEGRVLQIVRAASMDQIGPTKSGRGRRLTLGATTAALWSGLVTEWGARCGAEGGPGPWLFSPDQDHQRRMSTSYLAHLFDRMRIEAGVPAVTLHRLRHGVATFLVDGGQILKAQQRLGHADASTTLRIYAHALPLEDVGVADAIDAALSVGS